MLELSIEKVNMGMGDGKMDRRWRSFISMFFSILLFLLLAVQVSASKTDYSKYPDTKYEWYIIRKSGHEKAGGGIPAGMDLSKYKAYFQNTETNEKVIYLSFDCGYEIGYTNKILKTLKKHNAKAIFFLTKPFIESNPSLVKKMKKQGHLLGNHTSTHPSLPGKSVQQIRKEIKDCEETYKKVTGCEMDPFIRPPMGEFSKRSLKVTKDMGYSTILWSMAYYDYDVNNQPGKDYVVKHFKDNYHKGALPLIHNTSSSNCEALDDVLAYLEKKKYRFGTLDEFALEKGTLKIKCNSKEYNGEPVEVKIVKNTNKDAKIKFIFKNAKGEITEEATEPGTYTVTAVAEATRKYCITSSNEVKFKIKQAIRL